MSTITTAGATAFRTLTISSAVPDPSEGQPDAAALWGAEFDTVLRALPAGDQVLWGIPFDMEAADANDRWLWLGPATTLRRLAIEATTADYLVAAHFCVPSPESAEPGKPSVPWGKVVTPGELLGRYVLEYADGAEAVAPVRRRFEVNDAWLDFGHAAFAARPYRQPVLRNWRGPHGDRQWGYNQQSVSGSPYGRDDGWQANYWICAIPNPDPARPVVGLRLESVAGWIGIGGLTLFSGQDHPLRHGQLETLRITSSEPLPSGSEAVRVDLGLLGHRVARIVTDAGQMAQGRSCRLGRGPGFTACR